MENVLNNPVLSVQCDWNLILSEVGAEAWISCKYKDQPSIHGKIRTVTSLPEPPSVSISDGFIVENVSPNVLSISLKDGSHKTTFLAPEKEYKFIHKGSIHSLDVNEDGLAVSWSGKDSILVWDIKSENVKIQLNGHIGEVYRCRFFPSGKVILSGGSDMSLKIWCAITGKCPVTLRGHTMAVTGLDMVGRGKNVISCSKDGTLKLWNCGDAACIDTLVSVGSSINSCHLSVAPSSLDLSQPPILSDVRETDTEDKMVLYGCEDGLVGCIALHSRRTLFTQRHAVAVNCVAWMSPYLFLVGRHDGQVLLYSLDHPAEPKTVWHESNSSILGLLPYKDLGFFLSRSDGTVFFLPTDSPSLQRISLTGSNCDPIYDLATDGKRIFTACRDGAVRQYSIEHVLKTSF